MLQIHGKYIRPVMIQFYPQIYTMSAHYINKQKQKNIKSTFSPLFQYQQTMDTQTQSNQFLKYLNLARENPTHYITLIQSQLSSFVNNKDLPLAKDIIYETIEGRSAWIEAKHFLLKQKPIHALKRHNALCKVSTDHQKDICKSGKLEHQGSDSSDFNDRIWRYCEKSTGAMAEIIGIDFDIQNRNSNQFTVLGLIIDDGISGREHRKTIFNPLFSYVGWSTGKCQEKIVTIFNLLENNFDEITPKGHSDGNKENKQNKENIGNEAPSMTTTKRRFKKVFGELVPLRQQEMNIPPVKAQQITSPFFKPHHNQMMKTALSSKSTPSQNDGARSQPPTQTLISTPKQNSTSTPTSTTITPAALSNKNTNINTHAHHLSQKQDQSTQNNDNVTAVDHNEVIKHEELFTTKITPVSEQAQAELKAQAVTQPDQSQQIQKPSKKCIKLVRKISQKHQNTKTIYEDKSTIVEITTKIVYQDGSVEQVVDRKITYENEDDHVSRHDGFAC